MNITEYVEAIAREFEKMGIVAKPVEVDKANGLIYHGLSIRVQDSNVGMNIYADDFFERGIGVEEVAREIKKTFDEHVKNIDDVESLVADVKDYEKAKERLVVRMYNKATKAPISRSAKRYGFDDLILVPVILLDNMREGQGTIKVTEEILEKWGIDKNTLFRDAIANTKKDIKTISLSEMMNSMVPGLELPDTGAMIVSNQALAMGAAAILGALADFKKKYKEGFYVLPSSIHEVIVFPKGDGEEESKELTQMVREVNATTLAADEILSDKAYMFG